jgi:probable F420-dependent oxidoreductase
VPGRGREVAEAIGRVGAWSFAFQAHPAADEQRVAAELEAMGYRALWIPEAVGSKEVMSHAGLLLAGTERLTVATGIASIWARDPMAMVNGGRALAEAYPGRFILGIGVSHAPSVARRGSRYERPLERMVSYLDAMESVPYRGPDPPQPAPVVLAALGPRMLELAAERADGAHSYFVPVEHTGVARKHLGPEPLLAVEVTAVLEADAGTARSIGRAFARDYLALPNYTNNLRRLGWTAADVAGEGSDRLIDAVIARGDVEAIRRRVDEHLGAGADHVCVQFVAADRRDPCLDQYRALAGALGMSGRA